MDRSTSYACYAHCALHALSSLLLPVHTSQALPSQSTSGLSGSEIRVPSLNSISISEVWAKRPSTSGVEEAQRCLGTLHGPSLGWCETPPLSIRSSLHRCLSRPLLITTAATEYRQKRRCRCAPSISGGVARCWRGASGRPPTATPVQAVFRRRHAFAWLLLRGRGLGTHEPLLPGAPRDARPVGFGRSPQSAPPLPG